MTVIGNTYTCSRAKSIHRYLTDYTLTPDNRNGLFMFVVNLLKLYLLIKKSNIISRYPHRSSYDKADSNVIIYFTQIDKFLFQNGVPK